ncbi:MAG: D-alanine--D-alanine ligase [Candidatus Kerfeldbacteria bacterium]|nr:D-alanine--D-alanine ligase [Candidatus Kerfeldbacteria bacterium]
MKRRLRLGILFGGRSAEHEISIASARSVLQHLDRARFDVVPMVIRRDGRWVTGPAARQLLEGRMTPEQGGRALAQGPSPADPTRGLDVVFPILHGRDGEDGTVQGMLELFDVPYVGSGVLASALGLDKLRSRRLFRDAGLHVPRTIALSRPTVNQATRAVRSLGLPVFVKPNQSGSSIGVTRVQALTELATAVRTAREHDDDILIEQGLPGRELTVAVLGDRKPRALPVIEIVPTHGFFDLYAKYRGVAAGETLEQCPANIPVAVARRVQHAAIAAHTTLGCRGLTRTDLILSPRGRLTVLELNTIPGFTAESLAPKSARAAGIPFTALLNRLIDDALRRSRRGRSR